MSMMTTDCVFEASGGNAVDGERHDGQRPVRAAYTAVFEQYPDAQWAHARHFVAEDRDVSEWTFTGTRKDGMRVELTGCDLFTLGPKMSQSAARDQGRQMHQQTFRKLTGGERVLKSCGRLVLLFSSAT